MLVESNGIYKSGFRLDSRKKYDAVHVTNILFNPAVYDSLLNNFVFLFITNSGMDEDNPYYGHVDIELIHFTKISPFHMQMRENGQFHTIGEKVGNFVINEFVEIFIEEDKNRNSALCVYAKLKNQKVLDYNDKPIWLKNFDILLFEQSDYFSNTARLSLPKEFELQVLYEKAYQEFVLLLEVRHLIEEDVKSKYKEAQKRAASILNEIEDVKAWMECYSKRL